MTIVTTTPDTNNLEALLAELTLKEAAEAASEYDDVPAAEPVNATPAPAPAVSSVDFDEAALLADLNDIQSPEVTIQQAETGNLDDSDLADLEASVARAEAYEAQTSDANVSTVAVTADPTPKAKRERKASAGPRAPRKDLADLNDDTFRLYVSELPGPANKATTIALRPKQVKVAEKFDNLFMAIDAGKMPSSYIVTAYKRLKATGTMTSVDLANTYKAEGLKDGTASSQTGQIMALFSAVSIANRAGQALTLRADSEIAVKLDAILAANTTTSA